jgi:prepilin-type N-terminal cleavage/methylation domain-containing protein
MSISSQWPRSGSRGFTLVELLVVISIMLILTSVFVLRQQRFNSSTLLRSLAYSVALSVRQAQVYGTSIRESSVGAFDANTSAKAYGIYFSSGSTGSYILFADANNNGQYDSGESVQAFTLSQGYAISKFCATTGAAVQRCWTALSPTIANMTIIFKRPNPDSCFATSIAANACQTGASPSETYASGYVQIKSSSDTRSVTITLTGQITVGAQGS